MLKSKILFILVICTIWAPVSVFAMSDGNNVVDKIQWTYFKDGSGIDYTVPYSWEVRNLRTNDLTNLKELESENTIRGIWMGSPDGYYSAILLPVNPGNDIINFGEVELLETAHEFDKGLSNEFVFDYPSAIYFQKTNILSIPVKKAKDDGLTRNVLLSSNYHRFIFAMITVDPDINEMDLEDNSGIFAHTIGKILYPNL